MEWQNAPAESYSKCCGISKEGQASAWVCLREAPPPTPPHPAEEVVLVLGLEGSWGPSGRGLGRGMSLGKTKHCPGTEFSCRWSCRGSKKAFYALMGREAEVKAGEGGKRKKGPSSCSGKGNRRDGLNLY